MRLRLQNEKYFIGTGTEVVPLYIMVNIVTGSNCTVSKLKNLLIPFLMADPGGGRACVCGPL